MKKLPARTWTIILALIVLTALLLLAISLNSLVLADGKPLPVNQMAPPLTNTGTAEDLSSVFLAILRVLLILMWVLVPFYIIYLIISKEARKRFIRDVLTLLPFLLLIYWLTSGALSQNQPQEFGGILGLDQSAAQATQEAPPPMPEFTPPPEWVTTVISIGLAAVVTVVAVVLIYAIWRGVRNRPKEPLRQIEQQAQEAIDSLEAGGDLREVIQRCYFQMIDALHEYRNIQRDRDVTPHEFELLLHKRGLPDGPVHQLTALFEQVRYGAHEPGRQDERMAINSLSAIVSACRRARDAGGRS